MLTDERYQVILNLLEQQEIVKTQEIIDKTGSSESTIRRDLSTLENQGLCVRVHGGAKRESKPQNLQNELEMEIKSSLFIEDKKKIAQLAASLIVDGDVIFLDAGTTTYELIPLLKGKNVTVVTNGIPHANLLADLKVSTILLGGKIKMQTKATIGSECLQQLRQYRFSKSFLGMNGVDFLYGYTTPDIEEANIKRTAISHAAQAYVLADASKFKEVSFTKVADLDECEIITHHADQKIRALFEKKTNFWEESI